MNRTQGARLLVWGGSALFLVTSLAVSAGWLDQPDLDVDQWVLHHVSAADRSFYGGWGSMPGTDVITAAAVAMAGFLAWRSGAVATALILVVAAMLGGLLVDMFKDAYHRPYPRHAFMQVGANGTASSATMTLANDGNATRITTFRQDDSNPDAIPATFPTGRTGRAYPSGHTMGGIAWAVAILLGTRAVQRARPLDRWAIGTAVAIALVVGVARVVVRAHWASDVVGSWGLGAALIGLAILMDDAWHARKAARADTDVL